MMKPWCLTSLALLATPTLAEETLQALFGSEQSVTIATGRAHASRTAPAVATVITAEDIRRGGFRSVVEALRLVPGFHQGLTSDYGANLAVRGFSSLGSGNLLVLLDGVAQTDWIFGHPLSVLGTIPLEVIERLEVTRGPGSSVFGADAFSGVINVITRDRVEQGQLTLGGGSKATAEARLLAGDATEDRALVLSAQATTSAGHRPTIGRDQLSVIDAGLGTAFSEAPSAVETDQRDLGVLLKGQLGATRALARLSRTHEALGAGVLGVIDPTGVRTRETVEGRLTHTLQFNPRFGMTLQLEGAQTRLTLAEATWLPDSALVPEGVRFDSGAEQETWRLRADGRYAAGPRHFISAGLAYEQLHYRLDALEWLGLTDLETRARSGLGTGTTVGLGTGLAAQLSALVTALSAAATPTETAGRRHLYSAYVQDEWWPAPKWSLTWGARLDDYTGIDQQISPRAVLVWTPEPDWTLKLLYGEGFRVPTVLETQGGLLPTYQANSALQAERLRTVELAVQFQPRPALSLGLNVFRHETVDQIRLQNRGLYAEPENVGRQVGEGFEVEWRWALSRRWLWRGWYAYQANVDETSGANAGYSPHHRLYASLQSQWGRTFVNLQGLYVGDRARVAEDARAEAPEYGQLDLLVRHELTPRVSLQLDVRNLLNANLLEASPGTSLPQDLPLAGRLYYAALELRF